MNGSQLISKAFNDSVKNRFWLILGFPILIYFILNFVFGDDSIISYLILIIMFIIELGVIYKVIYHILEGNSELPKADFKIFDVELITGGRTSFIRLIPFYILLALIGYIDNFIIYFIGLIILFILFNLIGLVLAHGINTDSYIDGIVKLPEMIKSIEIGT